jgi:hypothetical protein
MQSSNLTPGTQIKLYKKVRGGYRNSGIYTVVQVTSVMVALKKEDIGYTESVSVLDLRQRLARIFLVDGTEVKFASLPDIKKLDEEHRNKVNEEYESMFREEREFMAVITREAVKKMFDEGKSVDEIVAEFKPSYPNARESILKAKVSLYIKEPKKKKEAEPAPADEEEKIVDEKQKEEAMQKPEEKKMPDLVDKYDLHAKLCMELNETYRIKNPAYGDAFGRTFQKYGPISALTRMNDKWDRIEALILGAENKVQDERLEDTLMDMACYCLMTIIELGLMKQEGMSK